MAQLGIVRQNEIDDELVATFYENKQEVIEVSEKEEVDKVSGLILTITNKEQINTAIEWLVSDRNTPSLFVWIFSTIPLEYEQEMLMLLGANEVTVGLSNLNYFILSIKNNWVKLDSILITKSSTSSNEILFNDNNRSIIVDNEEYGLTNKEYKMMDILYNNKNRCVSYEELAKLTSNKNNKNQKYLVANFIFHLRNKLGKISVFEIETVRSVGYMIKMKETE